MSATPQAMQGVAKGRRRDARREETRRRLLDAAVRCLVDHGYAGTTTQRLQDLAGVSRGALLHHFPTKADLLVAAIHHVAEQQAARIQHEADALPDTEDRREKGLAILRASMSGPLFLAGLELWMAARTDPELRAALLPAERDLGRVLHKLAVAVFGPETTSRPGFPLAYDSLLQMLRGLALTSILRTDRHAEDAVLSAWLAVMPDLCEHLSCYRSP